MYVIEKTTISDHKIHRVEVMKCKLMHTWINLLRSCPQLLRQCFILRQFSR